MNYYSRNTKKLKGLLFGENNVEKFNFLFLHSFESSDTSHFKELLKTTMAEISESVQSKTGLPMEHRIYVDKVDKSENDIFHGEVVPGSDRKDGAGRTTNVISVIFTGKDSTLNDPSPEGEHVSKLKTLIATGIMDGVFLDGPQTEADVPVLLSISETLVSAKDTYIMLESFKGTKVTHATQREIKDAVDESVLNLVNGDYAHSAVKIIKEIQDRHAQGFVDKLFGALKDKKISSFIEK